MNEQNREEDGWRMLLSNALWITCYTYCITYAPSLGGILLMTTFVIHTSRSIQPLSKLSLVWNRNSNRRTKKCWLVGPSFPLRRIFRSREHRSETETDAFSERKEEVFWMDGWREELVTRKYHSFIHFNPFLSHFCWKEKEGMEWTLMNMVVG